MYTLINNKQININVQFITTTKKYTQRLKVCLNKLKKTLPNNIATKTITITITNKNVL